MISTNEIHNVLLLEFPYFKKINEEKRQLLCKRTKHFIEGTDFIPRQGMVLTNRMLILISACSQQLTLGFTKHYDYAYIEKVIIYPEKYLSTYTDKYHTGEMNTAGIIVLSWEDFYKGIKIDNDARNVGLHEFAHALDFMDISNKDIDETFSACLNKFTALADYYLQHQPEKPLFRSYATTNLTEFFAVATEYYFEAPKQFVEREPALFDILNKAYQQNTVSEISTKRNVKINNADKRYLGDDVSSSNYSEGFYYLILGAISIAIAYKASPIGALVFLFLGLLLNMFGQSTNTFSLYDGYVRIKQKQTGMQKIIQYFFSVNTNFNPIIPYSDVLYVNAQYFKDDEGHGDGYSYTLYYLQNNKLLKMHYRTSDLNCERVLKFLYLNKKVGTRLNGNYKKFR